MNAPQQILLQDWRRRIFELYGEVRAAADPAQGWRRWRDVRDDMFRSHEQSPIPERIRASFKGVPYFDYDPAFRTTAELEPADDRHYDIATSGDETMAFTHFADARFHLQGGERVLQCYWLGGYGGGLFVPFADATSGSETYGAGRYLLDTVKGADLGMDGDALVLDFNFAYNPSCAYDPRWVCPLAPPPNRLDIPIHAGERAPPTPNA